RSAPVVTFMVTYLVGSRNEAIGHTGATHLLEHLMFKGSQAYNKDGGQTIWTLLQNVGARLNATTWLDRTNYFELLPREHLETALAVEADRMRNALLRDSDRQPEMTVVRNEFERGENDPWESLDKNMWATAYQAHPYHHSTIGWRSDIEGISTERLRQFYDTYYWPNNAVITVIGDFETAEVQELIEEYFGSLPPSPHPIPEMYTAEPRQEGPRRFVIKRAGEAGIIGLAHKTPPGRHPDNYPLAVLNNILGSGKTSRFYRKLIDTGLATSFNVWSHPFRDNGLFMNYAFLTPGTKHQRVEDLILETLEQIKDEGVSKEEVARSQAMIQAAVAFSRDGSYSIASLLNEAISLGDWTYYTTYRDKIAAVSADDIRRVVREYFNEDQSTTGWFVPTTTGGGSVAGTGAGKPALVGREPLYYRRGRDMVDPAGASGGGQAGKVAKRHLAAKMNDSEVAPGLRLVTLPMSVPDVVTIFGSLYGGYVFNSGDNNAVAEVVAAMLDKGTHRRDKFAISELLESVGARIGFNADDYRVNFSAQCLHNDVPLVVELLTEQLREPAFAETDLESLKKRMAGNLLRDQESTDEQARLKFTQLAYPEGHPNYTPSFDRQIADIERLTVAELGEFHRCCFGRGSMLVVATGDVDHDELAGALGNGVADWPEVRLELPTGEQLHGNRDRPAVREVVSMAEKTSVDLFLGQVLPIHREHPDFMPLHLGSYVLGGNFAARLMTTVRDEAGLTYGIGSGLGGAGEGKDAFWITRGTFGPELLEEGQRATLEQITKWVDDGITTEELAAKKSTLTGTFKVGLATTKGIAMAVLDILERGRDLEYIDEYPLEIEDLSLEA
ncbi:MAG: pitrilysin family protein, partial [Candidatus Neomarinimicrobiota bacterium]